MTIKKDLKNIWKEFVNTVKTSAISSWEQVRNVAKATFKVFKTALIDFITALGNWLYALVEGIAVIVFNLIKIVGAALLAAIKATIGLGLDWLISKIRKF